MHASTKNDGDRLKEKHAVHFLDKNEMKDILRTCLLVLACSSLANAQTLSLQLNNEGISALAKAAREKGDAVRGAVLLPQEKLGCANCHLAGNKQLLGPDLTKLEKQTTDEYLVESILAPSKTIKKGFETSTLVTQAGRTFVGRVVEQNPDSLVLRVRDAKTPTAGGTLITIKRDEIEAIKQNEVSAMPENLADQLASRQEFLDLVKYLMELAATDFQSLKGPYSLAEGKPLDEAIRGRVLIDRFRCEACHDRFDEAAIVSRNQAPNLVRSLSGIDPSYVERFIADPHQVKPGTSMPQMMGRLSNTDRQSAAKAITHYLHSLTKPTPKPLSLESLNVERGRELFHSVGCVACHAPRDLNGKELLKETSIPLANLAEKYSLSGLVAFVKNPHVARPSGRMPNLELTHWEALDIAAYLLNFSKDSPTTAPTIPTKAKNLSLREKSSFRSWGVFDATRSTASQLLRIRWRFRGMNPKRGCLSDSPGKWPRYQFTDSQRKRHPIRHPAARSSGNGRTANHDAFGDIELFCVPSEKRIGRCSR